jgi:hypothetical protein
MQRKGDIDSIYDVDLDVQEAPQELASGLDGELKKLTQQIQTSAFPETASKKKRI